MGFRAGLAVTLMIVSGLLFLAGLLISYSVFVESKYAPTKGRVLSSEMRKVTTHRFGSSNGASTRTRMWRLFVTYEYWIGGERFVSDRVAASPPGSNASIRKGPSEALQALARRYEAGKDIEVFVSPHKPKRSALIRARQVDLWLPIIGDVQIRISRTGLWMCGLSAAVFAFSSMLFRQSI